MPLYNRPKKTKFYGEGDQSNSPLYPNESGHSTGKKSIDFVSSDFTHPVRSSNVMEDNLGKARKK